MPTNAAPTSSLSTAAPVPQNIREEEDMMRQAIAESLHIGVEQVDPEHVKRNLGYHSRNHSGGGSSSSSSSSGAARRSSTTRRLPLNTGVFC